MRHEMHYDNKIDLITFQIMNGKINLGLSGSILTLQHLTESLKTSQQSLWTCCQQSEALWDY